MISIDIIISKKKRWDLKDHLISCDIRYWEWFTEFDLEDAIISIEADAVSTIEEIYTVLEKIHPESRLILSNGRRIKTREKTFKEIEKCLDEILKGV
jgi:myosin-crossreactive antigen